MTVWGANIQASPFSFLPSSCLSDRPARTAAVSYPTVCGRKTPPTIKLAHTLGPREREECLSVRIPYKVFVCLRMGGADMLIYPLRPISTPSHLLTRGSAIPFVSINLAEHHLTQLPAHSTGSSAAGLQRLGCQQPYSTSRPSASNNRASFQPCSTAFRRRRARDWSFRSTKGLPAELQSRIFTPSYGCAPSDRATHEP